MDQDKEIAERVRGINFILQIGSALKVPQLTLATASTFYHRFYMRKSFKIYHPYNVGAACLFLSTKVEETGRKLRDVIVVCVQKAQKKPDLIVDDTSKEYQRWKDVILVNEEIILETLCFDLSVQHPYEPLLEYVNHLQLSKRLSQTAWAFVNDSFKTRICLQYRPHIIAAGALYVASKLVNESLPESWWEDIEFDMDGNTAEINREEIKDASIIIVNYYISRSNEKPKTQDEILQAPEENLRSISSSRSPESRKMQPQSPEGNEDIEPASYRNTPIQRTNKKKDGVGGNDSDLEEGEYRSPPRSSPPRTSSSCIMSGNPETGKVPKVERNCHEIMRVENLLHEGSIINPTRDVDQYIQNAPQDHDDEIKVI